MTGTLMYAALVGEAVGLLVGIGAAVVMYRRWLRERRKSGQRHVHGHGS